MPEPTASGVQAVGTRYGRTTRTRRRDRWLLALLGVVVVVLVACWAVWAGFGWVSGSGITVGTGATQVLDGQHVKVSYTVSAEAGASVACAIEAQDIDFTVTGWKVVQLPRSSQTTRSFTTTLRTMQPSVSGSVDSCWSSATR
ncbi:hypothetical protein GCM10028798_22430 [Humibacter antri]